MTSLAAAILFLSAAQSHWLAVSFNMGSKYNVGYTFSSIIWQESSFCRYKVNAWSRGCAGLKRSTARAFDPGVTRKQLTDDNLRNLKDGLSYFLFCQQETKTLDAAIYAYHYGVPFTRKATQAEIERDGYVRAVHDKIKQLRAIREDRE